MNISPVNYTSPEFKHFGEQDSKNTYSKGQKAVVAGMAALGTAVSCAILAKRAGYSLKPSKMFNLKNTKLSFYSSSIFTFTNDKYLSTLSFQSGSKLNPFSVKLFLDILEFKGLTALLTRY